MIPTFAHNGPVTNTSLQFAGYLGDNEVDNTTITINGLYITIGIVDELLRHGDGFDATYFNDLYKLRAHLKGLINNIPPV